MSKGLKIGGGILGVLLLVVVGFYFYVSTVPDDFRVEKSITVDAPPAAVYNQIINLENWPNWSAWTKLDPDMVTTYSDPSSGVGAWYSWVSEDPNVGSGKLTIKDAVPNQSMNSELDFGEMGIGYGSWRLKENENGGTDVNWGFKTTLDDFMGKLFLGVLGKSTLEGNLDEGLAEIKRIAEEDPTAGAESTDLPSRISEIEEVEVESMNIYGVRHEMKISEFGSEAFATNYATLGAFTGMNGIEMAGMPLALYYNWDMENDLVDVEFAFPVADNSTEPTEGITASSTHSGKALKITHWGDYSMGASAHEAMEAYMAENEIEMAGACWEIYSNDPMEVAPEEVETQIYYPIN